MKQTKNGESRKTENKANARAVFEQYWLQARHVENERLWLTNVFAIIFAALLGLITVQGLEWYIPAFGVLLSITGILSMHSLRIWFIRLSRLAEKIMINELGAEEYDIEKYRKTKGKLSLFVRRFWALPFVFYVFYSTMLALWSTLLLKAFGLSCWLWIVFVGIICSSLIFYWCVLFPRERKTEEEVRGKNK
jgi:hypothetical protein